MQDEFLVHTREGEPCPSCGGPISRIVVGGRSTYYCPAVRCGCAADPAAVRSVGHRKSVPGKTVKTEAIVLRSIRYGEADRILHLYSAARGRVGAIAKGARKPQVALRRPPGAVLPARPSPARRPQRPAHGDQRRHRRRLPAPALLRPGADRRRPRLRRGAATARLGRAQPARLQPALPLPVAARRPGPGGEPRSLETAPRLPPQAGAGGRLRSRAWRPAPAAARPST